MPAPPTYEILLVGFRNDLSRARTLRFLDGTEDKKASTELPRLLYTGLERPEAERLRGELELLGAQVKVRSTIEARLLKVTRGPGSPGIDTNLVRALSFVALTVVAIGVLLVVVANVRPLQRPRGAVAPPPSRTLPPASLPQISTAPNVEVQKNVDPRAARLNDEAIAATKRGDFATAVNSMRRALAIAPGDDVLTKNLRAMLVGWAGQMLRAQDIDGALTHLEEATTLGEDVEVLYALGATRLHHGDINEAETALVHAQQLAPNDTRVLLALAELHLRRNQRPEALAAMQRARELGATGRDLDRQIDQLGREVDTEWGYVERRSAHFQISFGDNENGSVVHTVLNAFEDAYDSVGSKLGQYPGEPTAIVLYTQQDFHTVTRTPDWAGGAYDGRIKLPVRGLEDDDGESLGRVARHEYAHRVVTHLSNGRCPVWLNEGLAVWAEESSDGDHADWANAKIGNRPLIPLTALDRSFAGLGSSDAELAYAESYLATRELITRHGIHRVGEFLAGVARQPFDAAFRDSFGEDAATFEDRWRRDLGIDG